jgi:uncharacterized membrane protein
VAVAVAGVARRATVGWRRALPHVPVAALVVAYAVRFSLLSVAVHDGFGTPPFDMAIPDQGIWLLSRFHAPFVTVMGRDLFGDHTSFILALVVPVYWIYPHAQALLVLQSCLLAGAAIPIYLLARRLIGNAAIATALAAAYLLNPALQNGNLEQFHVEAFLVPLLAIALWSAIEWRPIPLALSVAGCMLCKEDTAVLLVPLGIWVLLRRDRRWGAAIIAASTVWSVIAFVLITPAFLGAGSVHTDRLPFGGLGGLIAAPFVHPGKLARYLRGGGRPFYVWQIGASLGWAFLVSPEIAAVGLLTLGTNVISDFVYMHQIQYHYSMPLVPVLAIGTVYAIGRLRRNGLRVAATGFVTCCAIVSCVLWGLAPFSLHTYPHQSTASPAVRDANAVIAHLPHNAVVSAWYPYVSHIDHRTRIYMWPTPFAAEYWDLYKQEGKRLPFADQVRYVLLPTDPADLSPDDLAVLASISSQYRVVYQVGDVALYEHR